MFVTESIYKKEMYKTCSKCKKIKSLKNFKKRKEGRDGLRGVCRECSNEQQRKRYDKLKAKEKYINNREKILKKQKEYEHSEEGRKKKREYRRKQRCNPSYRIKCNVGRAVSYCLSLSGKSKSERTENIIGYKIPEIYKHLENLFDENTNWDNYGEFWEIDHIIPISLYDFKEQEEIQKCWNLRNLRPLERIKNTKKGNKIDWHLIEKNNLNDLLPTYMTGKE